MSIRTDQEAASAAAAAARRLRPASCGRRARWVGRLLVLVQVAFVLVPLVLAHVYAKRNRVNTLHLDDWAYAPLYEKAVQGTLSANDFFGGYLEHRPAVSRAIAVATTLATKGDMRAQSIVTFVSITLTWVACGLLLRRALGPWRQWWAVWGLLGWVLFNPVQWQELLWPILHMDVLPLLFLTLSLLVLGRERWAWLLRAGLGAVFAWLATYTFAAGLTLWVLIPLAVFCGYGFSTGRQRWRFLVVWGVPMAATLFLYFHGLKNEVERPFAYGQGDEETMTHSVAAAVRDPMKGLRFLVSLLGANFARGLLGPRNSVALLFGWLGVLLFAGLLLLIWLRRRDRAFRAAVLPFAIIALYGLSVAGMVAAGRGWASKNVGGSLNNRYACFAAAFTAGLVGLVAVARLIGHRTGSRAAEVGAPEGQSPLRRLSIQPVPVLSGLLGGLLVANWFYGVNMMESWHHARMRQAVDLHFSSVLGLAQTRGGPALNLRLAEPRAEMMDRIGFLHPPLAKSRKLSDLTIKGGLMEKRLAAMTEFRTFGNKFVLSGYTLFTGRGRPADAILITFDDDSSAGKQIVAIAYTDNFPTFWAASTSKDLQYVLGDDDRFKVFGHWTVEVPRESVPKGRSKIEAWALDFSNLTVQEIPAQVWVEN